MEQTIPTNLAPTQAEKTFMQGAAAGVEWADLGAPAVADVDRIVDELDPIADGAMTIIAQPDVPRNLTVTVTDANDSASGTVTIIGKDFYGRVISDAFTFGSGTKTYTSENIYAYVTSVVISGTAGAAGGDTLAVGIGNVIGLPKQITNAAAVQWVWFNGAPVTPDAVAVGESKSGVDYNSGTYDGSKIMRVAYRPGA